MRHAAGGMQRNAQRTMLCELKVYKVQKVYKGDVKV